MVNFDSLEISPEGLKQSIERGEKLILIDVREPWEYELCRIEGARLIPMGTIPANFQALDVEEAVICYCHYGQRSLDVGV